jgi:uncharacterized protein YlxW (UPF0749 family)
MVAEVFAGLGALKTAFDMTQGLQKIHDAVARDRAVIELQKEILAAQAAQSALVQSVSDLEKEVARLNDWEADKNRYQLRVRMASRVRPGASAAVPAQVAPVFEDLPVRLILTASIPNTDGIP